MRNGHDIPEVERTAFRPGALRPRSDVKTVRARHRSRSSSPRARRPMHRSIRTGTAPISPRSPMWFRARSAPKTMCARSAPPPHGSRSRRRCRREEPDGDTSFIHAYAAAELSYLVLKGTDEYRAAQRVARQLVADGVALPEGGDLARLDAPYRMARRAPRKALARGPLCRLRGPRRGPEATGIE